MGRAGSAGSSRSGTGRGLPSKGSRSIEAFQDYCRLAKAHGLSDEQAFARITRKRARELKELEARAKAEAKAERARRNELRRSEVQKPAKEPREKSEPSPDTSEPPPRRTRGPSRFKQTDLERAMRAVMQAKFPVAAIRIKRDGTILIIPGTPELVAGPNPFDEPNDWD